MSFSLFNGNNAYVQTTRKYGSRRDEKYENFLPPRRLFNLTQICSLSSSIESLEDPCSTRSTFEIVVFLIENLVPKPGSSFPATNICDNGLEQKRESNEVIRELKFSYGDD